MKTKNKSEPRKQKFSASDKNCMRVERRPDGNYNVTMTGQLAEKFMAANRVLENLKGRKVSEADTFGHILDEAISNFELNNPIDHDVY